MVLPVLQLCHSVPLLDGAELAKHTAVKAAKLSTLLWGNALLPLWNHLIIHVVESRDINVPLCCLFVLPLDGVDLLLPMEGLVVRVNSLLMHCALLFR